MLEGGKSGVVFKWINKEEILNKYKGHTRDSGLQALIDIQHIKYIATRPGTVINTEIGHGLFGNIYQENGEPLNPEKMKLEDIEKRVGNMSRKGTNIYKTVFSMTEEDTLRYGTDKEAWKEALNKRINEIAKASNIPSESIEWTASFHSKNGKPHCHLVFWNKDQELELNKRPFLKFKDIRKSISKEIFKEELEKIYDIKNVSKKQISTMTKEELEKYKESLKDKLKNPDLDINEVDTSEEENLIKKCSNELNVNSTIYLYNKLDPETFVEIKKEKEILARKYYGNEIKEEKEVLKFRNNGTRAMLYKNDDFTDTACFLTNFSEIKIARSKEELEKIIKEKNEKDIKIDNLLREIMPGLVPNNVFSNELREKSFNEITNRIFSLKKIIQEENEKVLGENKITFKYEFQQTKVKKEIDKIATLILNTSKDCKIQFNNYISSSLDIGRYLADIENRNDYERVKSKAKDEVFNKMGNQILQFLKESINENKQEEWENKHKEYESKNLKYELSKESYKNYREKQEVRQLINNIFNVLNTDNISLKAKNDRMRADFNNMTKEQIREYLKMKENSNGFDWFREE